MELGTQDGESGKMSRFLTEILEQPRSLNATLDYYAGVPGQKVLKRVGDLFEKKGFREVIFTGMGSSFFASYAACSLYNSRGIRAFVVNTSELLYYYFPIITEKTLLVCVSQSGESAEIVKLMEKLPESITCIGVTNDEESSLRTKVTEILPINAGKEEMTSTKTYTSTILVLLILGWYLSDLWGKGKIAAVRDLVGRTEQILTNRRESILEGFASLGVISFAQFIGRGPLYSAALQGELMFKEAAKVPAAGALGGEFRHGPMEMVKPGFNSILFAAEGPTYTQSIRMATDIAGYKGKVLLITNNNLQIPENGIKTIVVPEPDEYMFSIQGIIPVQLMAHRLAKNNGFEPGSFVHGSKVTVTE